VEVAAHLEDAARHSDDEDTRGLDLLLLPCDAGVVECVAHDGYEGGDHEAFDDSLPSSEDRRRPREDHQAASRIGRPSGMWGP
jgi:hypothetical protein